MDWSVQDLYQQLLALDEHERLDAKRAREIDKSIMETVCAYANVPGLGGGFLLSGLASPDDIHTEYWLSGIDNPDKILNDFQSKCRQQFNHAITIQAKQERLMVN